MPTIAPVQTQAPRIANVKQKATAVVGSSTPEKFILGRQVMFSMPDEERSGAALLASWRKHGLDPDLLPEARQPVHIFQSACSSVQQRTARNHHGHRIQILSNEVTNRGNECSYQITIRRWAGDVIEHDKTMTVGFDKHTNALSMTQLDGFDQEWAKILTAIQDHFDANAKTVPGQKIRNAVRETLLTLGAQNLRRKAGGVYFVPKTIPATATRTLPTLDALKAVLADLYGEDADFYILNWANDEGEREIVRKHFALNANEKARELSEKAWARVRQGRTERAVRSDLIENLENDRRVLLGQIKQFKALVNLEASDVEESIAELDEALAKLDALANEPAPAKP